QAGIRLFETVPDAHYRGDRIAPGNEALIQAQGALVVFFRALDLILLLRQAADVARIPEETIAALTVAVGQLRFLAIAQLETALPGFLEREVGFVDVFETLEVYPRETELGIGRTRQQLFRFREF